MEKKFEDTASESITIELKQKVKAMENQIETKVHTIENVFEKILSAMENKMAPLKSNDKRYKDCITLEERLQHKEKENF